MIIKALTIGTALITGWIAIALLAMLPGKISTAAVPIGTSLPVTVSVIGATNHLLIVRSDDPDFVSDLYASGALFVIPARQKTCLDWQA